MEKADKLVLGVQELPVTEWEVPEHRKILPPLVQALLNAPTPYLRVPSAIYQKQTSDLKHLWLKPLFDNLDALLHDWEIIVPIDGNLWRILQHVALPTSGKYAPLVTVIGRDSYGNFNLVSMHRRTESYFRRQLEDEKTIVRGS